MMKSNFKIKDKLSVKHKLQRQYGEPNSPKTKIQQEDLSLTIQNFLQSFQVSVNQLVNSNLSKQKNQGVRIIQTTTNSSTKKRSNDYDPRDRFIVIDLPEPDKNETYFQRLESWVGDLCREVLSISFNYFKEGDMTYEQAKVFASESFLRNLCMLVDKHDISAQHLKFIDKKMKNQMLPYIKSKYPMNTEKGSNKELEKLIKKIDNSEALENDFFHDTKIEFHYRQNGRYDDLIMQFLNEVNGKVNLLKKSTTEEKQMTNYEEFQIIMTKIFEKCYDEDWVNAKIKNVEQFQNGKNYQNKAKSEESLIEDSLVQTKLKRQNGFSLKNQIESQKYKQKVQEYTSFAIGRKIQQKQNFYSQSQIQSGQMVIKNIGMLRLLTKWCEQLWNKFQNHFEYFDKMTALKMVGTNQVNISFIQVKRQLFKQLVKEKQQILKFIKDLQNLNYKQQVAILKKQLQQNDHRLLQKYEKVTGKFICKTIKNLQSFIIAYLNRLIHGLTFISLQVFQKTLKDASVWRSPPNLISFKIGDLIRCKFQSKKQQTIRMFNQIQRISLLNPQKIKIIRIKNRLDTGTKDILINVKFNNLVICEIQLGINQVKSKFTKSSYNFNHYVYELERSLFGPFSEACTIWRNLESRSKEFQKMINMQTVKKISQFSNISQCIKMKENHLFGPYNKPFVCSDCSKHYYHNNYMVSHLSCKNCNFLKCANCQIKQKIYLQDKMYFLKDEQLGKHVTFWNMSQELPQYGICIFIQKNNKNPIFFKQIKYADKTYLFANKNYKMSLLKMMQSQKEIRQFSKSCVILQLDRAKGQQEVNISIKRARKQFILPLELRRLLDNQKETLSFFDQDLNTLDLSVLQNAKKNQLKSLKNIMLSETWINSLDVIPQNCQNLVSLYADANQIYNFKRVASFKKLQKLSLCANKYFSYFPKEIFQLKNLKQLALIQNSISELPLQINQCISLVTLSVNQNLIENLPDTFNDLLNLKCFYGQNNRFTSFPEILGQNKYLEIIDFSFNKMKNLPQTIKSLQSLKQLVLKFNLLNKLPKSMQKMTKLEICDISINYFPQIEEIYFWKDLKKLHVESNQMYKLDFPGSPQCYQHIEQLKIGQNCLDLIPSSIYKLKRLKYLKMNKQYISQFPTIFELENLEELDISQCQLKDIPSQMCNLKKLKKLNLSSTKINSLPVQFKKLYNLRQLNLNTNQFSEIPKEIFYINQLKFLHLQGQNITLIPEEISNLTNLQQLNLSKNQIQAIADGLGRLQNLLILNLTQNKIKLLNPCIFSLVNLRQLHLDENQIQFFDGDWKNLQKLTVVNLFQNPCKKYPSGLNQLYTVNKNVQINYSVSNVQYAESKDFYVGQSEELHILSTQLKQIRYVKPTNNENYFKNIQFVQMKNNPLEVFPEFIFDMNKLQRLNMENNQITLLPNLFDKLPLLKQFNMNGNLIQSLPESIASCKHLQILQLKCQTFRSFPNKMSDIKLKQIHLIAINIQKMHNIQKVRTVSLMITNQQLTQFPNKIQLIKADTIQFGGNSIIKLPQSMQAFVNMTDFTIKYQTPNIKQISNCFSNMPNLKSINLQQNQIQQLNIDFPLSLQSFNASSNQINKFILKLNKNINQQPYNLKTLNLTNNKLQQLPHLIGQFTSLTHLILTYNYLKELPSSIADLQNIIKINLNFNRIQQFQYMFYRIPTLEILIFSHNHIKQLSDQIQGLKSLKQLYGQCNQIQFIPQEIGYCLNLKIINFNQNDITEIPTTFEKLKLLESISMSDNQISVIPVEICGLIYLKELKLNNNKITIIPQSIQNLSKLQKLHLSHNQIGQIPFSIGNLSKLLQLDLSHNKIIEIPRQIGKLSKLTNLNIESNLIKVYPIQLCNYKQLLFLNIANCQLKQIPNQIQNIKTLHTQGLDITGNPLQYIHCYFFIYSRVTESVKCQLQEWKHKNSKTILNLSRDFNFN